MNIRLLLCLLTAIVVTSILAAGCSATGSGTKSASTSTLIGAIHEKTDDGTIEIEGDTDAAPLP